MMTGALTFGVGSMQVFAQLVGVIIGSIVGLTIWIIRKAVEHGAKAGYRAVKARNQKKSDDSLKK